MSSGLGYYPGRHSPPDEVVDAARPVAEIDGFYISHMRDQGDMLLESIEETIQLSREAGIRAVATHIKASPGATGESPAWPWPRSRRRAPMV